MDLRCCDGADTYFFVNKKKALLRSNKAVPYKKRAFMCT